MLYSADGEWWEEWLKDKPGYQQQHECWTQSVYAAHRFGLNYIASIDFPGFSLDQTAVHMGGNSGYQALNLAVLSGSKEIRLYGFDMKDSGHFFGNHPPTLRRTESSRYRHWVQSLNAASVHAKELGINILNCTPGSALRCFEFADD